MAKRHDFEPKIVGFLCNWCCYAGADLAGVSRFQYPSNIRVIRLMCSGRVDPLFILRAFEKGADGVFIGGCWLGECHYVTEGNYDALSMMHLTRKMLDDSGINPERLRLEWVSASEGIRFAEVMTDFSSKLKALGPLGEEEEMDEAAIKFNLEAVKNIVPYAKLVERERLRVHFETQEEYDKYFAGEELNSLFRELVADKLAVSRIMLLLREKPQTIEDISRGLGMDRSEVNRLLMNTTKQGAVRFDESKKRFSPV
ncbi:hydrogenase iron-sulfur subunit [Chloroflexota bacterium]